MAASLPGHSAPNGTKSPSSLKSQIAICRPRGHRLSPFADTPTKSPNYAVTSLHQRLQVGATMSAFRLSPRSDRQSFPPPSKTSHGCRPSRTPRQGHHDLARHRIIERCLKFALQASLRRRSVKATPPRQGLQPECRPSAVSYFCNKLIGRPGAAIMASHGFY